MPSGGVRCGFQADESLLPELEADVREECEKLGAIEFVKVKSMHHRLDSIESISNPPPATLWEVVHHDFQNYNFNHLFDFET